MDKEETITIGKHEFLELKRTLALLQEKYGVDLSLDSTKEISSDVVALSVFSTDAPPLVSLVHYLSSARFDVKKIAELLHRSEKTIYQARSHNSYASIDYSLDSVSIPLEVFCTRDVSIMEAAVYYLHKEKDMRFVEIAKEVNKDPRTIWTMWNRAKKKYGNKTK